LQIENTALLGGIGAFKNETLISDGAEGFCFLSNLSKLLEISKAEYPRGPLFDSINSVRASIKRERYGSVDFSSCLNISERNMHRN